MSEWEDNQNQTPDNSEHTIRVFVSYSREDIEWVTTDSRDPAVRKYALVQWLKKSFADSHVEVWFDPELYKRPHKEFVSEIEKAIERSDVAVLMLSHDFCSSDFIRKYELPPEDIRMNSPSAGKIIGIDLGITFSAVAYVNEECILTII